jgi:hypothetical protein
MMTFDVERINDALTLLGELLASEGLGPCRVAVCGGAALISCALVSRTTIIEFKANVGGDGSCQPVGNETRSVSRVPVDLNVNAAKARI